MLIILLFFLIDFLILSIDMKSSHSQHSLSSLLNARRLSSTHQKKRRRRRLSSSYVAGHRSSKMTLDPIFCDSSISYRICLVAAWGHWSVVTGSGSTRSCHAAPESTVTPPCGHACGAHACIWQFASSAAPFRARFLRLLIPPRQAGRSLFGQIPDGSTILKGSMRTSSSFLWVHFFLILSRTMGRTIHMHACCWIFCCVRCKNNS